MVRYYIFLIQVPLEPSDRAWQINHRGSWGGVPSINLIKSASPDVPERELHTEPYTIDAAMQLALKEKAELPNRKQIDALNAMILPGSTVGAICIRNKAVTNG
jgi:hypothetical protein